MSIVVRFKPTSLTVATYNDQACSQVRAVERARAKAPGACEPRMVTDRPTRERVGAWLHKNYKIGEPRGAS